MRRNIIITVLITLFLALASTVYATLVMKDSGKGIEPVQEAAKLVTAIAMVSPAFGYLLVKGENTPERPLKKSYMQVKTITLSYLSSCLHHLSEH